MHCLPKGVLDFGQAVFEGVLFCFVSFSSNAMQIAEVLKGLVPSNTEASQ